MSGGIGVISVSAGESRKKISNQRACAPRRAWHGKMAAHRLLQRRSCGGYQTAAAAEENGGVKSGVENRRAAANMAACAAISAAAKRVKRGDAWHRAAPGVYGSGAIGLSRATAAGGMAMKESGVKAK